MNSNTTITNMVITGVGGQGVLTLAEILAKAAVLDSLNVRVGEIHGMAQRGGHVVCTVRIGERAYGPIVDEGTADIVVGFEPLETLREIENVKPEGYVVMSTHVQYPVAVSMGKAEYPDHEEIISKMKLFTKHIVEIDAMDLAVQAGSPRSLNMVMLGATLGTGTVPISRESAIATVQATFSKRFEDINIAAVELGFDTAKSRL
jgi:indolepyruvate ferredoxin oxidoreductase beta subunit